MVKRTIAGKRVSERTNEELVHMAMSSIDCLDEVESLSAESVRSIAMTYVVMVEELRTRGACHLLDE